MADEALVLAAQVVDQFSDPIRSMQRQLRMLVENNARAHVQGTKLVKTHTEAYGKLLVSVRKTARQLQGDFAPVVEKLGFAATSTGLAFGGLTAGILGAIGAGAGLGMLFQGTAQNLTRMHEATGLSIDALRTFEALGPQIGASSEQMDAGLRNFADRMDYLRKNPFLFGAQLKEQGMLPDLRRQIVALRGLKPEDQLKAILDLAEKLRAGTGLYSGRTGEKKFLAAMGLPENFADYPGRIKDLIDKVSGQVGHMTDAQVAAGNQAAEAWQGLRARIGSISDFIGSKFIPMLNRGYDATAGFVVEVQSAVSKYEPLIEGYLTSAGNFFDGWRAKFAQSDLGTWLQVQAAKIKGIDWSGRADQMGRALIPNFDDLKAKVSTADLPGYFSKLWTSILAINTSGTATVGSSLRDNLAQLKTDLMGFLNDPMVKDPFKGLTGKGSLAQSVIGTLPDWKGPLDDLKQLVKTGAQLTTVIDGLAQGRVNWSLIFDLTGFQQIGDKFQKALEPGGFLHGFREFFDAINRKAGIPGTPTETEIRPPVQGQPSRPVTPTPTKPWEAMPTFPGGLPTFPGALPAPAEIRQTEPVPVQVPVHGQPSRPVTPTPKKPWELMPTFSQAETQGLISKVAFNPGQAGGLAQGASGAIAIIAAGTRKGVYDGLYDFWQTMKGMKDRALGVGVTPASYETGAGGPGGVAGGLPGGSGGEGAGKSAAGAGGLPGAPAVRVGHEIRHQRSGTGAGPEASPGVPYTPGDITKMMGITPKQYQAFTSGVAQIEGGAYGKMGGAGGHFAGRYQFGRPEITETAKRLGEPNPTTQQFLHDPKMQERYMEAYSAEHYRELMREPRFQALSQTQKLEMMGYAHNQGVGGALKYLRSGQVGRDAFGTAGTAYFEPIKKRLDALAKEPGALVDANLLPARPVTPTPPSMSSALAKHGEALRKMFGERGPQKAPPIERQALPAGQQDVSLRPSDLQRREPGALLKASNKMQADASATHKVTGEASLRIKLASGLVPDGGVKNKGSLFKSVRMDRAPLPLASTMG